MWLINVGRFELEYFLGDKVPPYTILSHRWSSAGDEVHFQDWMREQSLQKDAWESAKIDQSDQHTRPFCYQPSERIKRKRGWRKVELCCTQTRRERLVNGEPVEYSWIDTCCIDKNSSAELSEAINSMFQWYRRAHVCYVFLEDVPEFGDMEHSEWWSRGWTLQELLAPKRVTFYDHFWTQVGTRERDRQKIAEITSIDIEALDALPLDAYSVANKMSWAAGRRTTRDEDRAYSMLGILGVNMPLLYGEGSKAFHRLQEELLRSTDDSTVFAWTTLCLPDSGCGTLLAPSPDSFLGLNGIRLSPLSREELAGWVSDDENDDILNVPCPEGTTVSNRGISTEMLLLSSKHCGPDEFLVPVGFTYSNGLAGFMIRWNELTKSFNRIVTTRPSASNITWLSPSRSRSMKIKRIMLANRNVREDRSPAFEYPSLSTFRALYVDN